MGTYRVVVEFVVIVEGEGPQEASEKALRYFEGIPEVAEVHGDEAYLKDYYVEDLDRVPSLAKEW